MMFHLSFSFQKQSMYLIASQAGNKQGHVLLAWKRAREIYISLIPFFARRHGFAGVHLCEQCDQNRR